MLEDPREIEIISTARQKNVRDPNRSRVPFNRIFSDFLAKIDFQNATLLDLGPGQYDFGVLARDKGAETHAIDNDKAVIKLGNYKGFPVKYGRLQEISTADYTILFDGIFCKFSINAFWFDSADELQQHIRTIVGLLKPEGWAWIAPWNGVPKTRIYSDNEIQHILSIQAHEFSKHGFVGYDLNDMYAKHYGVHGTVANNALFLRNVSSPLKLRITCAKLC